MIVVRSGWLGQGPRFLSKCLNQQNHVGQGVFERHLIRRHASSESLPRILQPSIWHSVVPKFLRDRRSSGSKPKSQKSKEWNPATFYIVIFLLIGSNAINLIGLQHQRADFERITNSRIASLKEVLRRVQDGEDVDVEGMLGTGDAKAEKDWEEALKDIEQEASIPRGSENKPSGGRTENTTGASLRQWAATETTSKAENIVKEASERPQRPKFF